MEQENNSRKSSWGYFGKMVGLSILGIIFFTIVILTCLSLWMNAYTHHSERVEVPRLAGVPATRAAEILEEAGLKSMVIDSVYADMQPGAVVEQLPAAGLPVKKGRQALSTLRSLGFRVDSIKQVPSEMDDLVLSVTVGGEEMVPGKDYPFGTHVVVSVGNSRLEIEPVNEETEEQWLERPMPSGRKSCLSISAL